MTHPLSDLTHLDAIGVMAEAHQQLQSDPNSTLRELAEARRVLRKAEAFQFSLTPDNFDFSSLWQDNGD